MGGVRIFISKERREALPCGAMWLAVWRDRLGPVRRRSSARARIAEIIGAGGAALALMVAASRAVALPGLGCEPVERFRLQNGVEVVLEADHSLPAVAVLSSVHVGQRNDPPGHEDLAHYVEHLTFRSAAPFTPADDLYSQLGAVDMNATTSFDTTDYFAVVPSAHLEQALWIESRRLAIGLDPIVPAAALEERSVLLREYELRFAGTVHQALWAAIAESFYPKSHPYRSMQASSPNSIEGLSLVDARWFFARYYRPARVRLVVVGDFDTARAKASIAGSFGTLRARAAAPPSGSSASFDASPEATCRWAQQPSRRSHSRVIVGTRSRTEELVFVWSLPSAGDSERWLSSLTTFADTARDALRQAGIASYVEAGLQRVELGVFGSLVIVVTRGRQIREAESLVRKLFADALASQEAPDEAVAMRQAVKTTELLRPKTLLSRAQRLAVRLCQPAQCSPARTDAPDALDLRHFALEQALVIEARYRRNADRQGDVEVVQ